MAKKQQPIDPTRTFTVDGIIYTEGSKIQVLAPELGLVPVVVRFERHSHAQMVHFDFGDIRTPLPCSIQARQPNASLTLCCTRMPPMGLDGKAYTSNRMRLTYFCGCSDKVHVGSLVWDVTIDVGIIRAVGRGWNEDAKWQRHPVVPDYDQLEPISYAELNRTGASVDRKGQFNLF